MDYPAVTRAWLEELPVLWRGLRVRVTAGGCVSARITPVDPAAAWPDRRKSRDRWVEIGELEPAPPGTVVPKAASDRPARQLTLLEE